MQNIKLYKEENEYVCYIYFFHHDFLRVSIDSRKVGVCRAIIRNRFVEYFYLNNKKFYKNGLQKGAFTNKENAIRAFRKTSNKKIYLYDYLSLERLMSYKYEKYKDL